ncbi:hypothetical protein NQ315_014469, partial [Exocentrus adspersus]
AVVTPTPMAGTHQEVSDDSLCNNYDILDLENSETIILELSEEFPTYKKADDLRKPKNPALTPLYLKNNRPLQNRNCDPSSGDSNRIVMELAEAGALKEKTPKRSEEKRTSTNNESSGVKVRHKRGPQSTVTRRSGINVLSSSHIAKKYDELLDQRKILLEKQIELANQDITFQKTKNKLEIEILTLKLAKEKENKN